MTPPIVIELLATLAIVCGLAPLPEPWEPDPADVALVSRTIWGEARGCELEEQEAVAWCIVLRKRSPDFPNTIEGVVLQPNQWQGYNPDNPEEPFHEMAREILIADHNGEAGPCRMASSGALATENTRPSGTNGSGQKKRGIGHEADHQGILPKNKLHANGRIRFRGASSRPFHP